MSPAAECPMWCPAPQDGHEHAHWVEELGVVLTSVPLLVDDLDVMIAGPGDTREAVYAHQQLAEVFRLDWFDERAPERVSLQLLDKLGQLERAPELRAIARRITGVVGVSRLVAYPPTCRPAVYPGLSEEEIEAHPARQGDSAADVRAVKICELDVPELPDVIACGHWQRMCNPCLAELLHLLWDVEEFVLDDLDYGVGKSVPGAAEARAELVRSLEAFSVVLVLDDVLDDPQKVAGVLKDDLPNLAEVWPMHELVRQVSMAATRAKRTIFRPHEDPGWLPDPDYPEASQW